MSCITLIPTADHGQRLRLIRELRAEGYEMNVLALRSGRLIPELRRELHGNAGTQKVPRYAGQYHGALPPAPDDLPPGAA